jgi:flagellar motility protein MotE (MotC chaperone)
MNPRIHAPRLLPSTIVALALLLLLKCGMLLEVAVTHGSRPDSAIVAAANAASTEQTKERAKPPPPTPAAEAPKPAAAPASAPPVPEGPPPVSETEKAVLQELRQRRKDLDARAEAVSGREAVLVATEQKLTTRVNELQSLQAKLAGMTEAQKQKEDAGWQGLVKLYESMKPKDAATIFNDLSMPVLLQLMDRMKDSKAASVMAAMTPDKARDVTAELAQMRTGRDASGAPVAGRKGSLSGG